MEQSPPWEADLFSASQKIPRILWNPNVHYRIHKCPPPVSILSQLIPAHTLASNFQNIRFYIILPSTPGSTKRSLSLMFSYQTRLSLSTFPRYIYIDIIIKSLM
jgi:hypothetical protein